MADVKAEANTGKGAEAHQICTATHDPIAVDCRLCGASAIQQG